MEDEGATVLIWQHVPVTKTLSVAGVTRTLQLSIVEEYRWKLQQNRMGAIVLYQLGHLKQILLNELSVITFWSY